LADDWIRVRGNLSCHPKVLRIAAILEASTEVGRKLATGYNGALADIVTRDVTRDVTLASLIRVWSAANEHTTDGKWPGLHPDDLDYIAGVPGFGRAMEEVGWAVYDSGSNSTMLPDFLEHNSPSKGGRTSNALRQKRYRDRKNGVTNGVTRDVTQTVTRNVTRNVTSNVEEKRRDITPIVPIRFAEFWERYPGPRKVNKAKCVQVWGSQNLDPLADLILSHVALMAASEQWTESGGKFVPAPLTYLNQRRWEDGLPAAPERRLAI